MIVHQVIVLISSNESKSGNLLHGSPFHWGTSKLRKEWRSTFIFSLWR